MPAVQIEHPPDGCAYGLVVLDEQDGVPGGGAALDICARREQRIDLLLTDVVMPEMLGPEVARRATAVRPDLKVLYMSGYIHQAIGGADPALAEDIAFVEKRFSAEALLTGVRAALDSETAAART
jgi:DNA-binding NtrC family response regulator